MTQVEQGARAGFAFVGGDHLGLGGAAPEHRLAPGIGVALDQAGAVTLQPGEELGLAGQAVLDHLGVAGQQLAPRQGREHVGIGEHQARLMEAADQVLAVARVDPGLAADRAVDLGQQGGRDLHEIDATQQHRGGETRDVADHPAAEGDQRAAAFDLHLQQSLDQGFQVMEVLGPLAGGQDHGLAVQSRLLQRALEARQMELGQVGVGDHEDPLPRHQRRDVAAGLGDQAVAHQDVVAARAQRNTQAFVAAHRPASSARRALGRRALGRRAFGGRAFGGRASGAAPGRPAR